MANDVIAMGGGGFSMEPENLALDRYVLGQARRSRPTVCFIPTASADSDNYIRRFYASFARLECRPRHLSLFDPPPDLPSFVAACDVFYVGGGNTRNLVALWREWELDRLLREAWEDGATLCGISAGAICWFEEALSDSAGPLAPIKCLGFLKGSCCPHYDGEANRRPELHRCLRSGALGPGYALEDGAALHFVGTELRQVVCSRPQARAYRVRVVGGEVSEEALPASFLGTGNPALAL